jgi:hypothetical protein
MLNEKELITRLQKENIMIDKDCNIYCNKNIINASTHNFLFSCDVNDLFDLVLHYRNMIKNRVIYICRFEDDYYGLVKRSKSNE